MNHPVMVAIDTAEHERAETLLHALGNPQDTTLKIGMELYDCYGRELVREWIAAGYTIFLDLKLHDIPNTVYRTAKQLAKLGISYTTVHALGGSAMIEAAKAGLIAGTPLNHPVPKLLAVTELTSMSADSLAHEQNCRLPMTAQVLHLAKLAQNAGADGVICSPLEVATLKVALGPDFLYVTPGIRPAGHAQDDQNRTATPAAAKAAGSSAIVVGRPITLASNPRAAYDAIKKEFN
ncbi:MAG: orotidine-5'-phosphate decarboxylase [Lactobacillus sp.]|nr:orotidine-5'-phosphate decarboxylase [Lactobacillus sp.]MDN6053266.1 orotidine-5'-phosphate decarboxylase [Lactobacillus sp.]